VTASAHDFKRPFVPGDILVNSWGYSMTLVDFYEVTRVGAAGWKDKRGQSVHEQTVWLRHIGGKNVSQTGYLSGTTVPDITVTKSPEIFRRTARNGRCSGHNSSGSAQLWDGQPEHYNHCD
jgi:hypothetical protein